MSDRTMVFNDENGNKVEYAILEQKLICGSEYVAMAPVKEKSNIEIYKIKFDKDWNETLSEVESETEIKMYKEVSALNF
ncbi:DUF1292 domain-containing protein [Clostridium tertium]|uniref:DUF1292 domain-containing protein n=1 Tax=Clostridium tertium TaxID=1559 RepID=A0A6N3DLG2_9CLOT